MSPIRAGITVGVSSLSAILDYFPRLGNLDIVCHEALRNLCNGQPRLYKLEQAVYPRDLVEHDLEFEILMVQVNWLRCKDGMKPVKSHLVGMQRTKDPEEPWSPKNLDAVSYEHYKDFWRVTGC